MTTKGCVPALEYLEKLRGGPLTFGNLVESHRVCDEVSQVSLAKKMGMSRAHLCDIEKGRRTVSVETAAKFAKALGYPEWLFVKIAIQDQLRRVGLKMRVEVHAA